MQLDVVLPYQFQVTARHGCRFDNEEYSPIHLESELVSLFKLFNDPIGQDGPVEGSLSR